MNGIDEEFARLKKVRADLSENRKTITASFKDEMLSIVEAGLAKYEGMFAQKAMAFAYNA